MPPDLSDTAPWLPFPVPEPASIPGVSDTTRKLLRRFFRAATYVNPQLAASLALALFTTPWRGRPAAHAQEVLRTAQRTRLRHGAFDLQMLKWPAAGPTVVVAHGWSSRAVRLSLLIQHLSRAGFTVVAFDAPGHGASSGLRSDLHAFRGALCAVLEWAQTARAVIGHSLGARAAMLLAQSPHISGLRALALLGMPPDLRHMMEQFKAVLALREDVRDRLDVALARALGDRPDVYRAELARELKLPVLVVHDENDDVAPAAHARHLAAQLPLGELHLTKGLNHCGILRDRLALEAVAEFLRRHCGTGARPLDPG
jgi:pimeloyl-ACP methyl ester carboxylesterase